MGNYGNTVDRWYHRAAFVLWAGLVGTRGVGGFDAVLFTLSVGLATGGVGITIAHELGHKRPALENTLVRVNSLAGTREECVKKPPPTIALSG